MSGPDKRGEVVALMGCVLCAVGALILGILAYWTDASSVWAAAFQIAAGVGIWLLTLIQLHQLRLVAEERLEVAELERTRRDLLGGTQTIFEEEELDQMEKLSMGRRLRSIEKFLVPAVALITAAYQLVAGASLLPWRWQFSFVATAGASQLLYPTAVLFFAGGLSFVLFMFSRYALGMGHLREWTLLRAGGNFMFGASAVNLGIAIAILCVISGLGWFELWLARAVGLLMIALAVETIANYVLDFYRPRSPGQIQLPFYDSRILGMFSEPGGILHSLADKIDYQFGFKVSETWFYRLLGRIVIPLFLVQIAIIMLLTCITVVPPGHKAIIEHLGPTKDVVGPGVHLTWFWPVDQATIIPVESVQRLEVGFVRAIGRDQKEVSEGAILWTKRHYKKEYLLLVADRLASLGRGGQGSTNVKSSAGGGAPPVNLVSMNMSVQWRVGESAADALSFHRQAIHAGQIIESLAYRELTQYAAGADILDLLGKGGIDAATTLQNRLQSACDHAGYDGNGLGVKVMHVGIGGVHPPSDDDVAKAYEEVVGAVEAKDAKIKQAEGDAARMRVQSAGVEWESLFNAIRSEDEAHNSKSPDQPARKAEVERLLRSVVGGIAREVACVAEKKTLKRVFDVRSAAELYLMQVAAYDMAPEIYTMRAYLKILTETLEKIRKYVIVVEDSNKVLYDIDLKPPQTIDILGAESAAVDMKQQQSP